MNEVKDRALSWKYIKRAENLLIFLLLVPNEEDFLETPYTVNICTGHEGGQIRVWT